MNGERVLICGPGWNEISVIGVPSAELWTLIKRTGGRLTALGFGVANGYPVIAAGDENGELSVWHAITGEHRGNRGTPTMDAWAESRSPYWETKRRS
jgi:hypothetical protein